MKPIFVLLAVLTASTVLAQDITDAARDGDFQTVKRIVQANPKAVAEKDQVQNTALHYAAMKGNLEMVDLLMKNGADVMARNFQKNLPAHFAVPRGHAEVVKKLVEANPAMLNAQGAGGMTLLMLAVRTNKALVEFLLEKKADVNLTNSLTTTALHGAAQAGQTEIVELLLKNGANVNARDDQGNNAAHWAFSKANVRPKPLLEVLVAYKIEFNVKGFDRMTVLDRAKQHGDAEALAYLKANGAK